jgi:uncharacterized protein YndB with AHSA1/START domain
MTITAVRTDTTALTLTIEAEYPHSVEQVWQLWADPRLLERWWGPPTYPATVVAHDFRVGGAVAYVMTGPTGDQHRGAWEVLVLEPPYRLELKDWFTDAEGNRNESLPTNITRVAIEPAGAGSRMTIVSTFPNLVEMEQLVAMGMVEGMTAAMGQIDAVLHEASASGH